jgi:hypothetical protein
VVKKILIVLLAAPIVLLVAGAVAISVARPPVPDEWSALTFGMTREEVDAAFPEYHSGLHELKGRDLLSREGTMLGEPCIWYLDLEFDDGGRLRSADLTFRNDISGLYNADRPFPLRSDPDY